MKKDKKLILFTVIIVCLLSALTYLSTTTLGAKKISFSDFIENIQKGEYAEVYITNDVITAKTADGDKERVTVPSDTSMEKIEDEYLFPQINQNHLIVKTKSVSIVTYILSTLTNLIPTLVIIWIFMIMIGRTMGSVDVDKAESTLTLNKVIGMREEKEEMQLIINYLKKPDDLIESGARLPNGVIMYGPPGVGKSYLARAVAGEAGVPFYSVSGGDLSSPYVSVSAEKIKQIFKTAKANAPSIIFIDEIDSIGGKRSEEGTAISKEQNLTINQLLVEMDGFNTKNKSKPVVVIAATNRLDALDDALLRSGRFDTHIYIDLPNEENRKELFDFYATGKRIDESVSRDAFAKMTAGCSPADIENILNEASVQAFKGNERTITSAHLDEAILKNLAGLSKKSQKRTEKERSLCAYHEAGHAIASVYTKESDEIHQITIIPRGSTGGATVYLSEDTSYISSTKLNSKIIVLLSGRAAEELFMNDISTGASNDIKVATEIAVDMVTKYGMNSEIGLINLAAYNKRMKTLCPEYAAISDREVHDLLEKAYLKAKNLLTVHRNEVIAVANALLEKETLRGDEFQKIVKDCDNPDDELRRISW